MFFLQLAIMSATVLLAYYMECTNLFSVHLQGFFCNDAELMKPYPGSEESSFVPPLVLYCVVAAAPTAVVSTNAIHARECHQTGVQLDSEFLKLQPGSLKVPHNPLLLRFIDGVKQQVA